MPASSWEGFKPPPYRRTRVRVREWMDEPGLDPALHAEALRGIEATSHWWGQRKPLLREIIRVLGAGRPAAGPYAARRFKLIEVGAGSGHMSRWIEGELKARGFDAEVLATDLVPGPGVEKLDCREETLPEADIYFSNLMLHHLQDWEAVRMLRHQFKASRLGVIHFEIQRHFLHYYAAKSQLGSLPRINQVDALLSIQQAFSRAELRALPQAAGIPYRLRWSLPFRWLLTLEK
jgi:hypothetical protein